MTNSKYKLENKPFFEAKIFSQGQFRKKAFCFLLSNFLFKFKASRE